MSFGLGRWVYLINKALCLGVLLVCTQLLVAKPTVPQPRLKISDDFETKIAPVITSAFEKAKSACSNCNLYYLTASITHANGQGSAVNFSNNSPNDKQPLHTGQATHQLNSHVPLTKDMFLQLVKSLHQALLAESGSFAISLTPREKKTESEKVLLFLMASTDQGYTVLTESSLNRPI